MDARIFGPDVSVTRLDLTDEETEALKRWLTSWGGELQEGYTGKRTPGGQFAGGGVGLHTGARAAKRAKAGGAPKAGAAVKPGMPSLVDGPNGVKLKREWIEGARACKIVELEGVDGMKQHMADAFGGGIDAYARIGDLYGIGAAANLAMCIYDNPYCDPGKGKTRHVLTAAHPNGDEYASTLIVEHAGHIKVQLLATAVNAPKGTGTRMLAEAAKLAADKGVGMRLQALSNAIPFYKKMGMKQVEPAWDNIMVLDAAGCKKLAEVVLE